MSRQNTEIYFHHKTVLKVRVTSRQVVIHFRSVVLLCQKNILNLGDQPVNKLFNQCNQGLLFNNSSLHSRRDISDIYRRVREITREKDMKKNQQQIDHEKELKVVLRGHQTKVAASQWSLKTMCVTPKRRLDTFNAIKSQLPRLPTLGKKFKTVHRKMEKEMIVLHI